MLNQNFKIFKRILNVGIEGEQNIIERGGTGWDWVELGGTGGTGWNLVELGTGWDWVELGRTGWNWVELGGTWWNLDYRRGGTWWNWAELGGTMLRRSSQITIDFSFWP